MNSKIKIKSALTIAVLSPVCSAVMVILHKITLIESLDTTNLSWLAVKFGTDAAAWLWGVAAYLLISVIYLYFEKYLSGSSLRRAFMFGGLVGSSWWIGMIELDQTLNNLIMGLVDAFMVLMVCILTALLAAPKRSNPYTESGKHVTLGHDLIGIGLITAIFTVNRVLFGLFLGKYFNSVWDFLLIPVNSILMGYIWVKLRDTANQGADIVRAARYSVIIWGIPSGIFVYFVAFLYDGMFLPLTIRNIFDIASMTLAVWISLKADKILYLNRMSNKKGESGNLI